MEKVLTQLSESGIVAMEEHYGDELNADLLIIDYIYENQRTLGLTVNKAKIEINQSDPLMSNVYGEIRDGILRMIKERERYNLLYHKIFQIDDDISLRKFFNRVCLKSHYIAVNGRIGPANFFIMNEKLYEKFKIFSNSIQHQKIFIDNSIHDKIIIGRKNESNQPGTVFIFNRKHKVWNVSNIGLKPEKHYEFINYQLNY